jgi:asparagine synthase (glutamine-hydrolysing)
MTDAIAHRGPDGEGFYTDSFIGLGHRRLAIIDLSPAGHQPMATKDNQHAITYNGELYNYRELRSELETKGYQFHSKTDTEVVLNAYVEWGEQALDRFNGMFAFAIWDKKQQRLFLARDRYGVKPLYYTVVNNVFIFASEIKAILQHPAYRIDLDKEALLEYFTFQNFFTERTLFKRVSIVPAGCYASLSLGTIDSMRFTQYWDYDFAEPEHPCSEQEYGEELDRLFKQAINRQLMSDVELGAYLSGGMDSGSITAIAAKQVPYLKTFTCGFDLHSASGLELAFDEREKAEHMSYLFKTEHYEMVLKAGDMERCMPKLAWHIEEPRVGQSYPNFYVSQLASKFVKVVLSGTGGDELFGGYPWRYYRAVNNDNFEHYIDKYYLYWQRLIDNRYLKSMFSPITEDIKKVWTRDIFRDVFKRPIKTLNGPADYVNHSLYFEAKTFLHGLLLIEDKLSMAHGLESRVPFLDNDLVDFAMKLPVALKLKNLGEVSRINENDPRPKNLVFFQKHRDGKQLLRKVMERTIPSQITQGAKQGFSAPDASWFKGESIEYVKKMLLNPKARIYEVFEMNTVTGLINEHLDGKVNRRLFIWSLLNFEWWMDRFYPK